MTDINRLAEMKQGYYFFSKRPTLDSFPSKLFVTPGLSARSMYAKFVPLYNPTLRGVNPYCTESKFHSVAGPSAENSLDTKAIPPSEQQVGHGEKSDVEKSEPEANIKLQDILEKMKRPTYDVKVFKSANKTKRKSEQPEVSAVTDQSDVGTSAKPKKLKTKKMHSWF